MPSKPSQIDLVSRLCFAFDEDVSYGDIIDQGRF